MVYSSHSRGIEKYDRTMKIVAADPSVVSVSPVVYGKVMIYSAGGANGIIVKGIDPFQEGKVSDLAAKIDPGVLARLKNPGQDRDGIILGQDLAESLHVNTGDLVTLVSPDSMLSPLGLMPKFKKFRILGEFHSGLYEYDTSWSLVAIGTAQRLFSLGDAVSLIEGRVRDIYSAEEIAGRLQAKLGKDYVTDNWVHQNKSLFSAMKLEKIMLFITIALIVLVAAFNVISTLVMMVLEKTHDIAILMAMGCTSRQIMRIFMIQGILIGVAGTIVGALLGVTGSFLMDHYRVIQLPLDVYFIPYLPFHVRPIDFALVTLTALAISFVSTLYPALRASRVNPSEALRYE